ncbi:Aste57867_9809 [Aphanomyces stellatus]|uniref:Aste57867_9809 protein n=1 Tax=Aphanomyces stellatus TaxID=120398 RepID=A0A485KNT9_9STRA|nr:hypothetical protein As57867_009770 [Aphanomyces stellatus]VFT86688.1 Aste57867_9809 [Aphanomyces stellatus]
MDWDDDVDDDIDDDVVVASCELHQVARQVDQTSGRRETVSMEEQGQRTLQVIFDPCYGAFLLVEKRDTQRRKTESEPPLPSVLESLPIKPPSPKKERRMTSLVVPPSGVTSSPTSKSPIRSKSPKRRKKKRVQFVDDVASPQKGSQRKTTKKPTPAKDDAQKERSRGSSKIREVVTLVSEILDDVIDHCLPPPHLCPSGVDQNHPNESRALVRSILDGIIAKCIPPHVVDSFHRRGHPVPNKAQINQPAQQSHATGTTSFVHTKSNTAQNQPRSTAARGHRHGDDATRDASIIRQVVEELVSQVETHHETDPAAADQVVWQVVADLVDQVVQMSTKCVAARDATELIVGHVMDAMLDEIVKRTTQSMRSKLSGSAAQANVTAKHHALAKSAPGPRGHQRPVFSGRNAPSKIPQCRGGNQAYQPLLEPKDDVVEEPECDPVVLLMTVTIESACDTVVERKRRDCTTPRPLSIQTAHSIMFPMQNPSRGDTNREKGRRCTVESVPVEYWTNNNDE